MEDEKSELGRGYFQTVVRDAIKELKNTGRAYVFFLEQAESVSKEFNGKVEIIKDEDNMYLLKLKE